MPPDCCRSEASDRQQSGGIIPHAVIHSLALLKMGKELPVTCWANLKINKLLVMRVVGPVLYLFRMKLFLHKSRNRRGWTFKFCRTCMWNGNVKWRAFCGKGKTRRCTTSLKNAESILLLKHTKLPIFSTLNSTCVLWRYNSKRTLHLVGALQKKQRLFSCTLLTGSICNVGALSLLRVRSHFLGFIRMNWGVCQKRKPYDKSSLKQTARNCRRHWT